MTTQRLTLRAMALAAAAGLILAGCAGEPDPTEPETTTTAPEQNGETGDGEEETTGEETTDEPTEEETTEEPTGGDPADLSGVLAAIALAETETGGVAFEVDDADGGNWEIYIALEDEEWEVLISGDGSEVLSSEREGSLEAEDRAGLDAATITIVDAIETAAEHSNAQIDDVNLESEGGGVYAWEVVFTDDIEVYVDVATGEVIRVETD